MATFFDLRTEQDVPVDSERHFGEAQWHNHARDPTVSIVDGSSLMRTRLSVEQLLLPFVQSYSDLLVREPLYEIVARALHATSGGHDDSKSQRTSLLGILKSRIIRLAAIYDELSLDVPKRDAPSIAARWRRSVMPETGKDAAVISLTKESPSATDARRYVMTRTLSEMRDIVGGLQNTFSRRSVVFAYNLGDADVHMLNDFFKDTTVGDDGRLLVAGHAPLPEKMRDCFQTAPPPKVLRAALGRRTDRDPVTGETRTRSVMRPRYEYDQADARGIRLPTGYGMTMRPDKYMDRDPINNAGIVGDHYVCCGEHISHPGCLIDTYSATNANSSPYRIDGGAKWNPYAHIADAQTFRTAWMGTLRRGTAWLDRAYYDALHEKIQTLAEQVADPLWTVFSRLDAHKAKWPALAFVAMMGAGGMNTLVRLYTTVAQYNQYRCNGRLSGLPGNAHEWIAFFIERLVKPNYYYTLATISVAAESERLLEALRSERALATKPLLPEEPFTQMEMDVVRQALTTTAPAATVVVAAVPATPAKKPAAATPFVPSPSAPLLPFPPLMPVSPPETTPVLPSPALPTPSPSPPIVPLTPSPLPSPPGTFPTPAFEDEVPSGVKLIPAPPLNADPETIQQHLWAIRDIVEAIKATQGAQSVSANYDRALDMAIAAQAEIVANIPFEQKMEDPRSLFRYARIASLMQTLPVLQKEALMRAAALKPTEPGEQLLLKINERLAIPSKAEKLRAAAAMDKGLTDTRSDVSVHIREFIEQSSGGTTEIIPMDQLYAGLFAVDGTYREFANDIAKFTGEPSNNVRAVLGLTQTPSEEALYAANVLVLNPPPAIPAAPQRDLPGVDAIDVSPFDAQEGLLNVRARMGDKDETLDAFLEGAIRTEETARTAMVEIKNAAQVSLDPDFIQRMIAVARRVREQGNGPILDRITDQILPIHERIAEGHDTVKRIAGFYMAERDLLENVQVDVPAQLDPSGKMALSQIVGRMLREDDSYASASAALNGMSGFLTEMRKTNLSISGGAVLEMYDRMEDDANTLVAIRKSVDALMDGYASAYEGLFLYPLNTTWLMQIERFIRAYESPSLPALTSPRTPPLRPKDTPPSTPIVKLEPLREREERQTGAFLDEERDKLEACVQVFKNLGNKETAYWRVTDEGHDRFDYQRLQVECLLPIASIFTRRPKTAQSILRPTAGTLRAFTNSQYLLLFFPLPRNALPDWDSFPSHQVGYTRYKKPEEGEEIVWAADNAYIVIRWAGAIADLERHLRVSGQTLFVPRKNAFSDDAEILGKIGQLWAHFLRLVLVVTSTSEYRTGYMADELAELPEVRVHLDAISEALKNPNDPERPYSLDEFLLSGAQKDWTVTPANAPIGAGMMDTGEVKAELARLSGDHADYDAYLRAQEEKGKREPDAHLALPSDERQKEAARVVWNIARKLHSIEKKQFYVFSAAGKEGSIAAIDMERVNRFLIMPIIHAYDEVLVRLGQETLAAKIAQDAIPPQLVRGMLAHVPDEQFRKEGAQVLERIISAKDLLDLGLLAEEITLTDKDEEVSRIVPSRGLSQDSEGDLYKYVPDLDEQIHLLHRWAHVAMIFFQILAGGFPIRRETIALTRQDEPHEEKLGLVDSFMSWATGTTKNGNNNNIEANDVEEAEGEGEWSQWE